MSWVLYRLFQACGIFSLFCVTVVGGVIKTTPDKWGSLKTEMEWIQEWAWLLIVILTVIAAACGVATKFIGRSWVWDSIRRTLDRIKDEGFAGIEGEPVHHNRVTLFRRRWCFLPSPWRHRFWPWGCGSGLRWPWSGWMVPIMRSGYTGLRSSMVFLAPEKDVDGSEGVAGMAWQTGEVQLLSALPSLTAQSTDAEIAEYADSAYMPVSLIRHRARSGKLCSRALCAIPVEVNSKIWGVIVLDSRKPDTINYKTRTLPVFRTFQHSLGELLRGI